MSYIRHVVISLSSFFRRKKMVVLAASAVAISLGVWMGIHTTPAVSLVSSAPPMLSYVEDGVLYQLPTGAGAARTPVLTQILTQSAWVGILHVQHDLNETLFVVSPRNGDTYGKGELWLLDKTGAARKISSEQPIDASFSPDGAMIALVSDIGKQVKILNRNGALIRTLPGRSWGTIVWSHDGKCVAYTKLSNPPCKEGADIIDSDLCKAGIALFNLESGAETLLTSDGNDDGPIAFSPDDSKLYISTGRPYAELQRAHVVSLWMVNVATKQVKRLTNQFNDVGGRTAYVPTINKADTLWSSDGSAAFSSRASEEGTWMFSFSPSGELKKAIRVANGDSPRWLIGDKSVVTHVVHDGKSSWQPIVIQ